VVIFHAPAALFLEKEHRNSFLKRLGGPQSRSGRGGEEKNLLRPCWELKPGNVTLSLVAILTELTRLIIIVVVVVNQQQE
jgi:hypothetical protein